MKSLPYWLMSAAIFLPPPGAATEQIRPPLSVAGIDQCRLDLEPPAVAVAAANNSWKEAIRNYPKAPRKIVVNPVGTTNGMPIFFVRDALQGGSRCDRTRPGTGDGSIRIFDTQTITGICRSLRGQILCSSEAVLAILDEERKMTKDMRTSPSLAFLFAHEFGHFLLGHPGAFTEGVMAVKFSADRNQNISAFEESCEQDSGQMQREKEADKFAFDVVKRLFTMRPYRQKRVSAIGSIFANSESIYWASKGVANWAAQYYGAANADPFPKTRQLCELVARKTGTIVVPVFGGGHPQPMDRLATIVNLTGDYINSLRAKERQSLGDSYSIFINGNRLTDTILARTFGAFASKYCQRISSIENGSLDCAQLPPESSEGETLNVDLGNTDTPPDELPLTFKPSGHYQEIVNVSPWALTYSLSSYNNAPTKDLALVEARKMAIVYEAFLHQVDRAIKVSSGYWVREKHSTVETTFNSISKTYMSSIKAWGIVRLPKQMGRDDFPALTNMERWGHVDDVYFKPWDQSSHEVVIHFFRPMTKSDNTDSQRVITRSLTFDEIFDLTAAKDQQVELPAQLFLDLLPFLYTRLKEKFGGDYTLDTGEKEDVFYITSEQMGDNFYLPKSWLPLIASTKARMTSDAVLLKAVDRIYINNQTKEDVDAIFGKR